MDELDAFELEVDTEKEALVSKLAVISLMDREARIDEWSDRELISRLTLDLHWRRVAKQLKMCVLTCPPEVRAVSNTKA